MALLHIFDSSDSRIRQTAGRRGVVNHIAASDAASLISALDTLVAQGETFDRVLFETHGSPGKIYFGNDQITANYLWECTSRSYTKLTWTSSRVYFNGCNVAEGASGWTFLEAAAALFLTPGGGEVFGQTSVGFGNPLNGHVVHLWGKTRRLYVDQDGRIIERFEQ